MRGCVSPGAELKPLELFPLEPGGIYLNHGTVGVTPRSVMQARA